MNISSFKLLLFNSLIVLSSLCFLSLAPTINSKPDRDKNLKTIKAQIEKLECENPEMKAQFDGPIIPEMWFKRVDSDDIRILYLLKNQIDVEGNDKGGGDLCAAKREYEDLEDVKWDGGLPTHKPLVIISSMLENDLDYSTAKEHSMSKEAFSLWKNMSAWVNVDKELTSGTWITDESKIRRAAQKNKALLRLQMNTYRPNVIICGNTCSLFWKPQVLGISFLITCFLSMIVDRYPLPMAVSITSIKML